MGRRWGKALALDTPIPSPDGWTTMGALRPGDRVFDEHGRPCTVTFVTEVMEGRPCYRVRFSDGAEIVADADHQWQTVSKAERKHRSDRGHRAAARTVTTEQIRQTLKVGGENNHQIPLCGPLEYSEKDLPIDPYTLGVWLGDGTSRTGAYTSVDEPIREAVEAAGYRTRVQRYGGKAPTVRVYGLQVQLRALGLLQNKHIPTAYLRGSVAQRLALLRGLMDTDGTIEPGGRCRFDVISEPLARGVLELCLGLGFRATFRVRRAWTGDPVYRVCFTPTINPFSLPRKAARFRPLRYPARAITAVEPVPSVPVKCITVDSPNHLYLAGAECIPTHNTVLGGVLAVSTAEKGGRVAWVAPNYKNTRPLWRWAVAALAPLRRAGLVRISNAQMTIEFKYSGGFLGVYSGDNEDTLRGEAFHLVVLDEAARLSETLYTDVVQPTVADYNGEIFLISTPKGRNWFWREYVRGAADMQAIASFHAPSSANPIPNIQRAAAAARERTTERTYRQEWMAEFVEEGGGVFRGVRQQAILKALDVGLDNRRYIYGIDWGKVNDATSFIVIDPETSQEVYVDRFIQVDYVVQLERLAALAERFPPLCMVVERNNVGIPLIEVMERSGYPVIPFKTTNTSKTDLVEALALAFERRMVWIIDEYTHVSELEAYEVDRTPGGLTRYGAPPGMHDDTVMALMLAWFGVCTQRPMFMVAPLSLVKPSYWNRADAGMREDGVYVE